MEQLPINRYLDHAVLKPNFSQEEAIADIQLGIDYEVRTVCVRPCDIALAVKMTKGTNTEVSCVLGFPHGDGLTVVKAFEAREYLALGADEIDMVVNYGFVRSGEWDLVKADIQAVANETKKAGKLLKTIFEVSQLTLEEVAKTTKIAIEAGADFVKTSTGFTGTGASVEAVQTMLDTAKGRIKVKPSGGIRDYETAKMYVDMGVHRLGNGSSSTPVICKGLKALDDGETY